MPQYQQFTLAQLDALFLEQIGQNAAFFRQDERTRILQEALRIFNCLTGFWRDRIDMGLTVQGRRWYLTPPSLTYILRVEVNQKPLNSSSLYDLDYGQPNWECETGVPIAFAPAGVNQFALWPASATGGESLIVEGVVPAPVLTGIGFVNLGQDEVEMILDYAGHVAQFKEGGQEFEASLEVFKEFLKQAGERNAVLMQSSKFRTWMGLTDAKKRPMRQPSARTGAR